MSRGAPILRARACTRLAPIALFCPLLALAGEDAPGWLKDVAASALPSYGPKVNSIVLLNEENNVVAADGRVTATTRTAIRILNRAGGDVAFFEQYNNTGGKVRDFRAWMMAPSGRVKKYGKDEIVDAACDGNDVYNECRVRMVSGKRDAEPGAVFAYEATVERQIFNSQLLFYFQESSPVRVARFTVTAPPGWELKAASFNGAPPEPKPSGATYAWEMRDLPAIEPEPHSPGFRTLAPWIGVNLLGPGNHAVVSWSAAAKLLLELNDGRAEPSPELVAKARSLVAGAATEFDKIQAIGRFTQQVNYVSIQVNLSKGGGYQPHAASEVFRKLYGDCKDKASLTRAMLRAVGITAYPVAIYSGDRTRVSSDWPSLGAFNHAILAIRVGRETNTPAVLDHPDLGRLLFFDPTDPYAPVGYLPEHEQASLALVGAPGGGLVRVPAAPPVASNRRREIEAVLKPDGSVSGSFTETLTGESLAASAGAFRARAKTDFTKAIEHWISRSIPGGIARDIETADQPDRFVLKGRFASARCAQMPQRGMMLFRAALLNHNDSLRLTGKARKYPVVIDADALEENVRIALPDGYNIDELPAPIRVNSEFGDFEAKWQQESGALVFSRKIQVRAQTIAAERYNELRTFLDIVYGSADIPVVLVAK